MEVLYKHQLLQIYNTIGVNNYKQFEMNGGIGTIFSRLSLEAPFVKDKSSFILAGRRSYIDVLAAPFLDDDAGSAVLNFYDLTLKTNYKFSEKDQIFLSGYAFLLP